MGPPGSEWLSAMFGKQAGVTIVEAIAKFLGWVSSVLERIVLAFARIFEALKGGAWGEIDIEDVAIVLVVSACVMGAMGAMRAMGRLGRYWDDRRERRRKRRSERSR